MAGSLGFYGDGISLRVIFSQLSDSESFLEVHALFSQDGCQREEFWEVVGQVVFPFDLSRTLLVGGGLLVSCFLPGPPIIKQLMQMFTMVPGQWVVPLTESQNKGDSRGGGFFSHMEDRG